MDYDGNDFQNQNFQLSGEENNRFPSGLRSFSLPKFELDDHFQVNLRFDSLVEPESLIGIQDQEERSWIEDFSSGNTTLEFNTGPGEPCSISRRKNVWSEATSSESVEILLKSVGEDDVVIDKQTSFIDLDAHNELIGVNSLLDPGCFQDSSLHSTGVKVMDEDSVLLQEKCEKELIDAHMVSSTFDDGNLESSIAVDEGVNRNTQGVIASTCNVPSDDCGLSDGVTVSTDESFVSKEKSLDGGNNETTLDSCKLDGKYGGDNASNDVSAPLTTEETREPTADQTDLGAFSVDVSAQVIEHGPEDYQQEVLPIGPESLVTDGSDKVEDHQIAAKGREHLNDDSEVFVTKLSRIIPEGLATLEMEIKPSSLLMEGYEKHASSEKDGLLEDVAHQIESLGKGNSGSGQVVTALSDEPNASICSVENENIDGVTQSTWPAKIDSFEHGKASLEREFPSESCELHSDSSVPLVKEAVIALEETENSLGQHPERSVTLDHETSSAASHGAQGREEIESHELPSEKFEEVQKSSEDEGHKNDDFEVDDSTRATPHISVPEAAEKSENVDAQSSKLSEEFSGSNGLEGGDSNVQCGGPSASANFKSHMIENSVDSSGQDKDTHAPSDTVEGVLAVETMQATSDCGANSLQSTLLPGHGNADSPLEPVCGSPTIIGSADPSSRLMDHQELGLSPEQQPAEDFGSNNSSCEPKENNASEERTFTFEVGSKSASKESHPVSSWKPFAAMESFGIPQVGEMSAPTSSSKKASPMAVSEGHPYVSSSKKTNKDRSRSVVGGSTERSTSKRRSTPKETSPQKDTTKRSATSSSPAVSTTPTTSRELLPREEKYQYSHNEGGGSKQLDSHAGSPLFLQPFTDAQQVQLRAQIFVYGSLIQGIPPDEACMLSAFGNNENARSAWEGTWRVSLEKFNVQKSPTASFGTPLPSHSDAKIPGARTHEQSPRSSLQSKQSSTPISMAASRSVGKGSAAVISNLMSLSSPVWQDISQASMPRGPHVDPGQIFSPAHGFQSLHSKQYPPAGGTPWLPPQASSLHWVGGPSPASVPFVAAQTPPSVLDKRTHFSAQLTTETTATPTPVREVTEPQNPNLPFLMTSSVPAAGVPLTSSGSATTHMEPEKKSISSTNQKARKRKKSEGSPRVLPEEDDSAAVHSHSSMPSLPAASVSLPVMPPPTHFQVIGDHGKEQRVILSEEMCSKIEQAKLQAEDAAAFAAAAIKHSEGIWSQIAIQRNSGLVSEVETKLASAAIAAAAASSVAQAAAAAARVASDAAVQAKMMASEAMASQNVYADQGANLPRSTAASLLKGKDRAPGGSTTSVIYAAREAARRRVEAASAASKRAENLDAIVKAAELAAVAVCQAGAVVAMGDPLPFTLNDLVEAGPEGHWKAPSSAAGTAGERLTAFDFSRDDGPGKVDHGVDAQGKHAVEGNGTPQTDAEHVKDNSEANRKERCIEEGSIVEVLLDTDNARRVWYSAEVISLQEGKAHVSYKDLPPDAGDKQREWIPLEGQVDQPPRIRLAHPLMTAVNYEGTRKRRRAAVGSYLWAVGDRVDASVHNGWCEGVVTEKSKEDETKLTVHFSGGEVTVIRAWQLRPSLVWKDGQWVEWSRLRENTSYPYEGDTPKDKRQKVGKLEAENYPKLKSVDLGKEAASFPPEEARPPLLGLSDKEKVFAVGKSTAEVRNPNAPKMRRTAHKEGGGSRVVFGVPKPGKKRKFMEVSKHYVSGKTDDAGMEGGDGPAKQGRYPPAPASGAASRIAPKATEVKGRKVAESKPPKAGQRPVKPPNAHGRGGGATTFPGAASEENQQQQQQSAKLSVFVGMDSLGSGIDSLESSSARHVAKKKLPGWGEASDGGAKGGRAAAAVSERARSEERQGGGGGGGGFSDAAELRRSNRRIQPTSRLLEGLQSSMVATKIPSVADKGARASSKNAPPPPPSKNGAAAIHG